MDPVAAVVIALVIATIGGFGVWTARSSGASWGHPILRAFGQTPLVSADVPDHADQGSPDPGVSASKLQAARPIGEATGSHLAAVAARNELAIAPATEPAAELVGERLARIEARLDELSRALERQGEGLRTDWRAVVSAIESRQATQVAEREAQLERMRADTIAALMAGERSRDAGGNSRRAEVSAEVYARLARLESALSAVTNPMLLPGEPYAPPREFLPESLVWENWGDVGERAFALADCLSAQRLHLSGGCREELGTFVTSLRTRLTQEVYPNLQPEPTLAQQHALRAVLDEIAVELPRVRETIEREYREGMRTG